MMKSVNKFRLLSEKELNRVYGGVMGLFRWNKSKHSYVRGW